MLRLTSLAITAALLTATSFADDLKKIAASIDGYRYEFPCKDPMPENPKPGDSPTLHILNLEFPHGSRGEVSE